MIAFAFVAAALAAVSPAGPLEIHEQVFRSGDWSACIVRAPEGSLLVRAISYRETVYRQGPDDSSPVWLFEEVSTGGLSLALGPDGLLFLQPDLEPPRLYFGDSPNPILLTLPAPLHWTRPYRPNPKIALHSGGHVSFFGDLLFYGQLAAPDEYLVGLLQIDKRERGISRSCVCLEASSDQASFNVAYAATIAGPRPVCAGDYIFWKNNGFGNASTPDGAWGGWKARAIRVVDIRTCSLRPLDAVPLEVLRENADKLAPFLP